MRRSQIAVHRPPPGLAFGEPDDRLQRVSTTPRPFDQSFARLEYRITRFRGVMRLAGNDGYKRAALRRAGRSAVPVPGAGEPGPPAGPRACRHSCRWSDPAPSDEGAQAPSDEGAQALSRLATVRHSKYSWQHPLGRQARWASLRPTVTGRRRMLYESNPPIACQQGYSRHTVNGKLGYP